MENEKQKKIFKKVYIYITIAAIIILTVTVFYPKYRFDQEKNKNASSTQSKYHGFMMLTLKQQDKEVVPNIAVIDLDKSDIRFFDNGGTVNMTVDGLKDKFVGVLASLPANLIGTQDQNKFQLYTVDMKNNFERKQLTKSDTFFKRNPKWTSDGEAVAFMARMKDDEKKDSWNPDDWNIYIVDMNGNERNIGVGAYPQWSPDKKSLLAMRADGLYLYDVATGESRKVQAADDILSLGDGINVSSDGSLLAWSMSSKNKISLMKISSWESFKMEEYRTMDDVTGFYPVFSPDMKSLAMILVSKRGDQYGNLRLSVYDIENSTWSDLVDLSKYSAASISLTVWGEIGEGINIY